jgi:hypothetical protein
LAAIKVVTIKSTIVPFLVKSFSFLNYLIGFLAMVVWTGNSVNIILGLIGKTFYKSTRNNIKTNKLEIVLISIANEKVSFPSLLEASAITNWCPECPGKGSVSDTPVFCKVTVSLVGVVVPSAVAGVLCCCARTYEP